MPAVMTLRSDIPLPAIEDAGVSKEEGARGASVRSKIANRRVLAGARTSGCPLASMLDRSISTPSLGKGVWRFSTGFEGHLPSCVVGRQPRHQPDTLP
jgi:hypothetical protein